MAGFGRRVRGAIGMGLTWAFCWAVLGVMIGVSSVLLPFLPWEVFFSVFDAPLPALAIPGFIGGVAFSFILGIAGRGRRFHELSLPKFAAWGALGGLLLLAIPLTALLGGGAGGEGGRLLGALLVVGPPFALLGAASATGTLLVARKAEEKAVTGGDEAGLLND